MTTLTSPDHTSTRDTDLFGGSSMPLSSRWTSGGYEKEVVDAIWKLAEMIDGNDSALWRKDECGAWINKLEYGKRHSSFGWEICDLSLGRRPGTLSALRPMQWENYVDHIAAITQSRVTADGLRNVRKLL
ncbi:MAG: hypothetical protein GXP30_01815 [Verrucomicrobia bacterium]|nr:hypothetical protein [Verrucomicrobiota bacterium]